MWGHIKTFGTFPFCLPLCCLCPLPHTLPSQLLLLQFRRPLSWLPELWADQRLLAFPSPLERCCTAGACTKQGMGMVPLFTSVISPQSLYTVTEKGKTVPKAPAKRFRGSKSSFFPHSICFFWKCAYNSLPLAAAQHDVFSLDKTTQHQLLWLQILLPGDSQGTDRFPSSRQHGSVPLSTCLLLWLCALFPLTTLLLR